MSVDRIDRDHLCENLPLWILIFLCSLKPFITITRPFFLNFMLFVLLFINSNVNYIVTILYKLFFFCHIFLVFLMVLPLCFNAIVLQNFPQYIDKRYKIILH